MQKKYFATLTNAGADRLAAAIAAGDKMDITQMAVGDGGGALPIPDPAQTALIGEVHRSPLNKLEVVLPGTVLAEIIIPPQMGGWWLREVALFAKDGVCVAIGNMPESYKPVAEDGSSRTQIVRIQLAVSSTNNVEMIVDPTLVIATREDVNAALDAAKAYTDQEIRAADNRTVMAIDDAIAAESRRAWDENNPIGTVRFFQQHFDPNGKWPWSTWHYLEEGRSVRVACADGSDVGQTGGNDSMTLTRDNLPAQSLSVTGVIQETDLGNKTTSSGGRHAHQSGWGSPGGKWGAQSSGSDNQLMHDCNYTSDEGEHTHDLYLGAHAHNFVDGKTENMGSDVAFSLVEANIKLMAWYRVA